jgi:hypothetical protein
MFTIQNWSYAPYSPGRDGLTIPLPKGFVGAVVADEYQERVAVTGEGFLWRGSIPPGGAEFRAGFSLPVASGGSFEFDMPLPHGAFDSSLSMLYTPGMEVRLPAGTQPDIRQNESGRRFYVLSNITILPKQRMVMSVRGLPHQPPWRRQVALAIGLVVLGMLLWALVAALRRTAAAADVEHESDGDGRAALRRRREVLLEELVELDKRHRAGAVGDADYEKRRAELVGTLEGVYAKLQRPAQAEF